MSLANEWIVGGDCGTSSKAIWARMMGVPVGDRWENHPHDPDDLGRCLRLLALMPEWRKRLPEMVVESPEWSALVEHWDELETLFWNEGNGTWRPVRGTMMRKTYDRMRELIDGARVTA